MSDGARHSLYYSSAESTYGEDLTGAQTYTPIRHTSCTVGTDKDTFQSQEIRSDRLVEDLRHGAQQCGGEVGVEISYSTFDGLLEMLLGGTWAADTPGLGTDQLEVGTTRRSCNLVRIFNDIASGGKPFHVFTGAVVSTLSMNISPNAPVTGTFGFICQDHTPKTAMTSTPTYSAPTTTKVFDAFQGSINEGGSSIAIVTALDFNITNNYARKWIVGSDLTLEPTIGRCDCTGTVTAFFEDATLLEKFLNETESSLDITLTDAAGNDLKIYFPRIVYTGGKPDVQGEGEVLISLPFQALNDNDGTVTTSVYFERTDA